MVMIIMIILFLFFLAHRLCSYNGDQSWDQY